MNKCNKNGIKREGESCTLNNNCTYPNCKLPTAEEFATTIYNDIYDKQSEAFKKLPRSRFIDLHVTGRIDGREKNLPEMMIEFAKLHVTAALKEASEKACIKTAKGGFIEIDKQSIINAYSLNNIK